MTISARPIELASPADARVGEHAVLRLIGERMRAGSRPRARTDGHVVALAIEGGGMRGAVSAGMCVVLEAAGAVGAFDRIYGVSAGAINGALTAAGHAGVAAASYEDAAVRRVVSRVRPLMGGPLLDLDLLFDEVIGRWKDVSFAGLGNGPEFRALATSVDGRSVRVLRDFATPDELLGALRASASLPVIGPARTFRGELLVDGGVLEPIPYETALREGATHVLVLRTRAAGYRRAGLETRVDRLVLRRQPDLALLAGRGDSYNRQAARLQRESAEPMSSVLQVSVPPSTRLVGRLDGNLNRVIAALWAGAAAMSAALPGTQPPVGATDRGAGPRSAPSTSRHAIATRDMRTKPTA